MFDAMSSVRYYVHFLTLHREYSTLLAPAEINCGREISCAKRRVRTSLTYLRRSQLRCRACPVVRVRIPAGGRYTAALEIRRRVLGENNAETARSYYNLAAPWVDLRGETYRTARK